MSTAALDIAELTLDGRDAHKHHADLLTAMVSNQATQTITGASTFEIVLADEAWTLTRSTIVGQRSRLVIDRAGFTLVSVKRNRGRVTLTFEDDAVAELRTHMSLRKAAAGTTTRPDFVRSLIRDVPDLKVIVAPGASKNLVELSRGSGGPSTVGGDYNIPAALPEYGTGVIPKGVAVAATPADVPPVKKEDTWAAAGRIMGEIGWRVFCHRGTITIAPDGWLLRHAGAPYNLTPGTSGVIDIDFDFDVGKPAATATVTAFAGFHDLTPGSPVKLGQVGPADGTWLVETIRRTTSSKQVTVDLVKPQPVLPEPKGQDSGLGNLGIPAFIADYMGDQSTGGGGDPSSPAPLGVSHDEGSPTLTDRFVSIALQQRGKPYIYGTRGPRTFDCAGFTYWCAKQVGLNFPNPVSSQAAICRKHGTTLTVDQAARTKGALLFRQRGGGAHDHVVISLGDGSTIEAMGRAYGVVIGKVSGRDWTMGGYVPGLAVDAPSPYRNRKPT